MPLRNSTLALWKVKKSHNSDAHEKHKNGRSKYVKRRFHENELIYLWKCFVILLRRQRVFVQLVNCHFNANNDVCWSLEFSFYVCSKFNPVYTYQHQTDAKESQRAWLAIGVQMLRVQCTPSFIIEFQQKIFK